MKRFVHSILQANQAIAADGQLVYDLPVGPLSCLYINLNPLNETAAAASYQSLVGLLSAIDAIRVTYRGASVIDLTGADLAAFIALATYFDFAQANQRNTDNERRSLTIPVPFGRALWDDTECFPRVKRGEMQLAITWDIADTGFDGLRMSIESLELPDAEPAFFQRLTTLARTFAATGDNDVDLPIGNILRGILCWGTTAYTGAVPAPTIAALRLLLDNVEYGYAATDMHVSKIIAAVTGGIYTPPLDHFHDYDGAAAAHSDTALQEFTAALPDNYTYLNYDPTHDDQYAIDTKGHSRMHLRVNAGAANAARFIIHEKVAISDFIRPMSVP